MSTRADERYVRASRANPVIPERYEPQAVLPSETLQAFGSIFPRQAL